MRFSFSITAALLGAATLAGCDGRSEPTTLDGSAGRSTAIYAENYLNSFGPDERGCATFEVRVTGRDRIEVAPTSRAACGPVHPVLAGTPTFDVVSRTVRLPVALENRGPAMLGVPAGVLGWEDSLVVVTAPGLAGNRYTGQYLSLANPDSTLPQGGLWRYDDRLSPAGQIQILQPGQQTGVRWIELSAHPGVETFRVTLHAHARKQVESVTALIGPGGGTLALQGFASVAFAPNSFGAPQQVTLSATSTEETRTDYSATAEVLFNAGPRLARELRINTGLLAPGADLDVRLSLPESFLASVPRGHGITVFGQWFEDGGEEVLDVFDLLPAHVDATVHEARFVIPAAMFTARRTADASYEAVVVLGTRPMVTGSAADVFSLRPLSVMNAGSGECKASRIGAPLQEPLTVTGAFNPPRHKGTDYRAGNGTPVFSASDGTVEIIGWDSRPLTSPDPRSGKMVKGWGRYVKIRHDDGTSTLYAHLVESSTTGLSRGDRVSRGQQIALANNSGGSSAPHLHLEYLNQAGERINPHPCIGSNQVTYRGYWTRSGSSYQYNPFEAVVTRSGSSVSVKWTFLPSDVREGTSRLEGDKVVWEYTQFSSPVTHRIKVSFDAAGCEGVWHHDYVYNNFYQYTNHSTCQAQTQVRMMAEPPLAPSDSAGRAGTPGG